MSRCISVVLLFILSCVSGRSATINWNFGSSSSTAATSFGSGYGSAWVFTASGVTVTATAWGLTGDSNTTFQTAEPGRYDTGLGVCNRAEGLGCDSPGHQVDNSGQADFILFHFSAAVDPLSVVINPFGTYDRDVTYYVGDLMDPLNLTGVSLSGLSALGFTGPTNSDSTASEDPRTVTLTSGFVNSLLFGSRVGSGKDMAIDRFKISSLSASTQPPAVTQTPEPATFGLFGFLLLAFGSASRLRRRYYTGLPRI